MKSVLGAVIVCAAAAASAPGYANSATPEYEINLVRSTVRAALEEFTRQTGLQTGFFPHDPSEERILVGPLRGHYTAQAALAKLLAPSGLSFTKDNERTITVLAPDSEFQERSAGHAGAARGYLAEQAKPDFVRLVDHRFYNESMSNVQALAVAQDDSATADENMSGLDGRRARPGELDGVVVTGSRLKGNTEAGPAPVVVFDRAKIDELGVSTVSDALRYLPQQPYSRAESYSSTGAQYVEMRGLGVDSTLVLINGRRMVPSAANLSVNAIDLNTLPLAAVERIEVLSDSASAVYGADAVGGVVNIILKKSIPDPIVDLQYGSAAGGADERRASLSSGYSGARFQASLVLDYFDKGVLLGRERELQSNQDFRRFGGLDLRSQNANPGNVTSRTTANLPGLPARFAAIPEGSTGIGLTPADFLSTAGARNLESIDSYSSIVPAAQRRSAAVFSEFELTPSAVAFGEALYVGRNTTSDSPPPSLSSVTVPATNPFNPFKVPVSVNYLFESIGAKQTEVSSDLYRGVVGLRGASNSWDWELSVLATQEKGALSTSNMLDAAKVNTALLSVDPAQSPNLFKDGPAGSPELLESLLASQVTRHYSSKGTQASAFIRGELFRIPSGAVNVVGGGEWREESIVYNDFLFVSHQRTVAAAFTEFRVPIASGISGIEDLYVTAAARYDNYSDFGSTVNPQFGLVWKPASSWLVRASYGTSFRPPSLFELYAPRTIVATVVTDPRRNNEVIGATAISGGNPDLDPITAESLTTGLIFSPSRLKGLRLSTSYWKTQLDKRVSTFSQPLLLANEDRFQNRVIRGNPTPADLAASLPGVITSVDISRINFGSLDTSGIDFDASWTIDTSVGRFAPSLSGTWVEKYRTVNLPNTPASNRVGIANVQGSISRWRGVGILAWTHGGLGFSVTGRYMPAYDDADPFLGKPTGKSIPSQTLVDVQGSFELGVLELGGGSWANGIKLSAGAINVFDKQPHFAQIGYTAGYDISQGDLKQRYSYIKLSKSF